MTWLLKWLLVALIIVAVFVVVTSAVMWTAMGELAREALTLFDRYHRRIR